MKYYNEIYINEDFITEAEVKEAFALGNVIPGAYIVYVNLVNNNLFEFIHNKKLVKNAIDLDRYCIIAITKSKSECKDYVVNLVKDWVSKENDIRDLRSYLISNCK